MILRQLKSAFLLLAVLTILTGLFYPLTVTVVSRKFFKHQAEGSLIERQGKVVGSELIGQSFTDPKYFWGRPSATSPQAFNAAASSGSNWGPRNPDFLHQIQSRAAALKAADPLNKKPIPIDLVTASASGLDPHISVAAAEYQIPRVARLRGLPETKVRSLVRLHTQGIWLGVVGEPVVNVLKLNLDLDASRNKV